MQFPEATSSAILSKESTFSISFWGSKLSEIYSTTLNFLTFLIKMLLATASDTTCFPSYWLAIFFNIKGFKIKSLIDSLLTIPSIYKIKALNSLDFTFNKNLRIFISEFIRVLNLEYTYSRLTSKEEYTFCFLIRSSGEGASLLFSFIGMVNLYSFSWFVRLFNIFLKKFIIIPLNLNLNLNLYCLIYIVIYVVIYNI